MSIALPALFLATGRVVGKRGVVCPHVALVEVLQGKINGRKIALVER